MNSPNITCVINGNAYQLSASDNSSLQKLSDDDRTQLLALLNTLQSIQNTQASAKSAGQLHQIKEQPSYKKGERLGEGDVDALMRRLILEEEQSKKTASGKAGKFKKILLALIIFVVVVVIIV